MSAYGVNKVLYQLEQDPAFRERFTADPAGALAGFPLTAEEVSALMQGDVATLYLGGAHPFLLLHLARHRLSGLDNRTYFERMNGLPPAGVAS